jgi:hypothetical protein
LHENVTGVGDAVAISILEHDNTITGFIPPRMSTIINRLRHPDAALRINVHIGRVAQLRRLRPDCELKPCRHRKAIGGHKFS